MGGKFGLRSPPPTKHLKKILSNYPEGSQVFKEALQNADDADARTLRILVDERRHLTSNSPESQRFLGPAIVIQNDSIFSDGDWRGLQNMFASEKEECISTIGKFGMGSRSYFHLTDVLFVASGDTLAFIDPDKNLSEWGGESTNFVQDAVDPVIISPFLDLFGFSHTRRYNGTIFRLPLRMGKWASKSSFAPYECSLPRAQAIVEKFFSLAPQCLLFLQSLRCVEYWRWRDAEDEPFRLVQCAASILEAPETRVAQDSSFDVFLSSMSRKKASNKNSFKRTNQFESPSLEKENCSEEVICDRVSEETSRRGMKMILKKFRNAEDFQSMWSKIKWPKLNETVNVETVIYKDPQGSSSIVNIESISKTSWLVIQRFASHPGLLKLANETQSCPQIGIAIRLADSQADDLAPPLQGKVFCYLPVPDVPLGLPVHIQGTFQLTDNRRSLWLADDDTEGQAAKWAAWNDYLCFAVFPRLYASALCQISDPTYSSWPDINLVQHHFRDVLEPFAQAIKNLPCILDAKGHRRLIPSECEFVGPTQTELEFFGDSQSDLMISIATETQEMKPMLLFVPPHILKLFRSYCPEIKSTKTIEDVFYEVLVPKWTVESKTFRLNSSLVVTAMAPFCRLLGSGATSSIQKFKNLGSTLPFIPHKAPGVLYGPNDRVLLKRPVDCFDPNVGGLRAQTVPTPTGNFRAPEALRTLRAWGLKQTYSWKDVAQDALCKPCLNEGLEFDALGEEF